MVITTHANISAGNCFEPPKYTKKIILNEKILRFYMQTRRKGKFCFELTLSHRLRAFLNKRTFDRRLNCNNNYCNSFHKFLEFFAFSLKSVFVTVFFPPDRFKTKGLDQIYLSLLSRSQSIS